MLPIKKIYIDSRFKSHDSNSDSDMKIDLPNTYSMPDNTVFYIDDVSIPVSWYAVDSNRNNKLYVNINGVNSVVDIPSGNYSVASLSAAIGDALNSIGPLVDDFQAEPLMSTNQIKISITSTRAFQILTDTQAVAAGFNQPLNSLNDVLRNTNSQANHNGAPFVSGYIDLFPIRNLYITSNNLGNFNTMSVSGESGIVKKVPVTSGYNEMIFDQVVLGSDYLDCSRQTLKRLEFKLKDVFGNIIDLNGNHWSCSIVFSKMQQEE